MTSKYLYVESWLIQYEFRTRKLAARRPTRSSAVDLRERWYFSWLTPWLVGLPVFQLCQSLVAQETSGELHAPYVAPLGTGLLRPPRRTRTR